MLQHHDGRKEESGRVGKGLASNIGSGTVDGLEDGALVTNVTRGGQTKTTDQTGAHVGKNVTVQVGHNQDLVVVRSGVGDDLQAGVVEKLGIELNVGVLLGQLAGGVEEETVGHLHDGGLVDSANLVQANLLGVLEGEAQDTLRGSASDELDGLDNTVDNDVLDARVFTLGVLTDEDSVDTIVGGLVALDRLARTDVGEEVEGTTESQVERDVTLANGGLEWGSQSGEILQERAHRGSGGTYGEGTLQGDVVAGDGLNGLVGDDGLAVLQAGGDIDGLPLDGDVGGGENVLDRLGDLGTDTVTLDQGDGVLAVVALGTLELGDLVTGGDSVGASEGKSGELLLSGLAQALARRAGQCSGSEHVDELAERARDDGERRLPVESAWWRTSTASKARLPNSAFRVGSRQGTSRSGSQHAPRDNRSHLIPPASTRLHTLAGPCIDFEDVYSYSDSQPASQ